MTLLVKGLFRTLQGEGRWAGTPSVFVRLAGCNLWSGHEKDREEDARKSGARCPSFCDTDFVGGVRFEVPELAEKILELAASSSSSRIQHLVFTGGEPLLQLNRHPGVLRTIRRQFPYGQVRLALETNGTVAPLKEFTDQGSSYASEGAFDWVCVSPKVPLEQLKLRQGHELKIVFPSYDPLEYESLRGSFEELLVSPEFPASRSSLVRRDVLEGAIKFCLENPGWRLSVQQHKEWNIP